MVLPTDVVAGDPGHIGHHNEIHAFVNAGGGGGGGGGGGLVQADYTIYTDAGITFAVNGQTGATDFSNADAGNVLSSVLGTFVSTGGTVVFKAGEYDWQSVPAIPPNTINWINILAEPGVTINLSAGGRRFLDFGRLAANDLFNFIWIEGFTIDAAGTSALTGHNHVVIGNYKNNGTLSGQDVDFDHIVIRRIRTLNVAVGATATVQNLNVWIAIHVTNTDHHYMTNILVEQCEFNGGAYGVGLYGTRQSGGTGEPDIWMDNIKVRDIWHDCGATPTGFDFMANVHLGSHAAGGRCWVERIYGKNSTDVGIEIDNFQQAFVHDVFLEDWFGYGIAITNFHAPPDVESQVYDLARIKGRRENAAFSAASGLIGTVQTSNYAGTPQPFGRVIATQCHMYTKNNNLDASSLSGDLAAIKLPLREFSLSQSSYYAEGLTHTSATSRFPRVIFSTPTTLTRITIRDLDIRMFGTYGVGSVEIDTAGIYLSGVVDFDISNVRVEMNMTNVAAASQRGIELGQAAGSTLAGTVRGLTFIANGTSARGLSISGTGTLTIPANRAIYVMDCDFSGQVSGTEINTTDGSNKAKVFARNNRYKTFPRAEYAITAPATTVATQYLDMWDATIAVWGGVVSLIEVSRDNVNWRTVATNTDRVFPIHHGEWFRLTYSSTPAIAVLAEN